MGLLQLHPDRVAKNWELISSIIKKAIPPTSNGSVDTMSSMIEGILSGVVQCWSIQDNEGVPVAVMTTVVINDIGSRTRSLCIYTLSSIVDKSIDNEIWMSALVDLKVFAKHVKCSFISTYTNVPAVIKILEKMGVDTTTTYAKFEIE